MAEAHLDRWPLPPLGTTLDASNTDPQPPQPADATPAPRWNFANLCRWAGGAALALSALVYMLQGIDNVDSALRHWVYLGLMTVLAGAGVASLRAFRDTKGARLCFALAAALIPVQFSQLAGVINLWTGAAGNLPAVDAGTVTTGTVAALGLVTLGLFVPISYAAFSVLARSAARVTLLAFLVANAVLLFPGRDLAATLAVIGTLGVLALLLERLWFAPLPVFRTAEGLAVRAIVLLPLTIALGRAGFAAGNVEGLCLLGAMAGIAASRFGSVVPGVAVRETLLAAGGLLAGISWLVFIDAVAGHRLADSVQLALALLPLAVLCMDTGVRSQAGRTWRALAALLAGVAAAGLLLDAPGYLAALTVIAIGSALAGWGVLRREREPALFGTLIGAAGVLALLVLAANGLTMSTWIWLAGAGVAFVVVSSALERYGRDSLLGLRRHWDAVASWQ